MIKQMMAEVRHFGQSAESADLVHKIISIIHNEKDKTYLVQMLEQYDTVFKHAEYRSEITMEMLKFRLAHLKDLYNKKGENPDPVVFYKTIFSLYPKFLENEEILQLLVENFKELMSHSQEYHKKILDLLEQELKAKERRGF